MISSHFKNIRKELLQVLCESKNEILIAVYWFTNQELFDCLVSQLSKGIRIKLIIHNDYINNRETGLPFQDLIDLGCEFYFSDSENPMHNKFCIIDGRILINGSYNWTYFAEIKNRENILVIREEKEVVESFIEEFKRVKG
jgi:phosphatidylserine/phosphatidylglycerophosphate/cardiolipin synthase-like enzyme